MRVTILQPSISSPAGARSVKIAIERRIRLLADFPFIAPMTEDPGVYELSMIRHLYRVYYRVERMRYGSFTSGMPRASDLSPMNCKLLGILIFGISVPAWAYH